MLLNKPPSENAAAVSSECLTGRAYRSDVEELEAYLRKHQIEARVMNAINQAAANRSDNPIDDIIAALSRC